MSDPPADRVRRAHPPPANNPAAAERQRLADDIAFLILRYLRRAHPVTPGSRPNHDGSGPPRGAVGDS
jgi:hypothetical protein